MIENLESAKILNPIEDKADKEIQNADTKKVDDEASKNPALATAIQAIDGFLDDQKIDTNELAQIVSSIDLYGDTKDFSFTLKNKNIQTLTLWLRWLLYQTTDRKEIENIDIVWKYIQPYARKNSIDLTISLIEKKKEFIKKDMQNDGFYKDIISSYIDKKFSKEANDIDLINTIKAKIPTIIEKNKKNITLYISKKIFTDTNKVEDFFNKDYSTMSINPNTWLSLDDVEKIYQEVKIQKIKEWIIKKIDTKLPVPPLTEEVKTKIMENMTNDYEKEIKEIKDINGAYKKIKNTWTTPFDKEIENDIEEVTVSIHKQYILDAFDKVTITSLKPEKEKEDRQKYKAHLNMMLKNTSNKNIMMLSKALNMPGKNPEIMQWIIETKDFYTNLDNENKRFLNAKFWDKVENAPDYSSTISNTTSAEIVSEENKKNIGNYITSLVNNNDVSSIVIEIPKDNVLVQQEVQSLLESMPKNPKPIRIVETVWISTLKISAKETKETTEKIKIELPDLPFDQTGDQTKIQKLLQNNPKIQELQKNNYIITGWEVYGSASWQRSHYKKNTNLQKYKDNDKIKVQNVKKTGDGGIQNTLESTLANQKDAEYTKTTTTNNVSLAYDRAAGVLDFFLSQDGKVSDDAKFIINYAVNSNKAATLVAPTSTVEDTYKPWQYATADFMYIKKEEKSINKEFPLEKKQSQTVFQIDISSQAPTIKWPPPSKISKLLQSINFKWIDMKGCERNYNCWG